MNNPLEPMPGQSHATRTKTMGTKTINEKLEQLREDEPEATQGILSESEAEEEQKQIKIDSFESIKNSSNKYKAAGREAAINYFTRVMKGKGDVIGNSEVEEFQKLANRLGQLSSKGKGDVVSKNMVEMEEIYNKMNDIVNKINNKQPVEKAK